MKVFDSILARVAALLVFGATVVSGLAGTNVVVWDTMKRGSQGVDPTKRNEWKMVPSDLMKLEKDPLKSASDPGYYGRDYQFSGDAVVENGAIVATFAANNTIATIYSKAGKSLAQIHAVGRWPGSFELIRTTADEVVLKVIGGGNSAATFTFGKNEIVEVIPASGTVGIEAPIEYGIVPAFVGDDLVIGRNEDSRANIRVPVESMFVGLLSGEDGMLVISRPESTADCVLGANSDSSKSAYSGITLRGGPIYITAMAARGIWHRQKLDAEFLEKDKTIEWRPPFMAKWQTQLIEGNVKTTYAFRHAKGTVWRGVAGSYNYPVWFDGEKANFSLSKKVPPKGEAVIYFLEGDDTPAGVLTPVDVLKATLGRPAAAKILDVEGRKLRTHHGDSGSNVHRACTCGYTEAIQAVFEKGEECDKKDFVDQSIKDMIYFVKAHLERIDEYRAFATNLTEYLHATAKSNPDLKEYLEELEATAQQIPAEYENQKENMKSLEYAAELEQKTMALTGKKEPENLKRYMELLKLWRGMGGAQDGVVAQYHILARKIFQDAGYNCTSIKNEKAIDVAKEVRARCKQILRNPDGYEVWANY